MTDNERKARYAEAIEDALSDEYGTFLDGGTPGGVARVAVDRVMAVADEEQAELQGALNYERDVACTSIQEQRMREVAELRAEVERMHALLSAHAEDAREDVAHWGGYASDYFAEKWHLDDDLAKWERRRNLNAALAGEQ
jgi:hypothetical protein